MNTLTLTVRLFQVPMVLIPLLLVTVGTTAAQQAPDSALVLDTRAVHESTPGDTLSGPRLSQNRPQSVQPVIPNSDAFMTPAPVQRGQHTIVFSTLALVLATILIVLLVVN